jgi:hypothetical protein
MTSAASRAVEFFGLLGGGKRDANWDRPGITQRSPGNPAGADALRHQHESDAFAGGISFLDGAPKNR